MTGSKDFSEGRRNFLKTGASVAGAVAAGFPAILKGAPIDKALKVGLVGCGGRGTGAASQALKADDYTELTAVADVFQGKIDSSLERCKRCSRRRSKVERRTSSWAWMRSRR